MVHNKERKMTVKHFEKTKELYKVPIIINHLARGTKTLKEPEKPKRGEAEGIAKLPESMYACLTFLPLSISSQVL